MGQSLYGSFKEKPILKDIGTPFLNTFVGASGLLTTNEYSMMKPKAPELQP
jgi:hypothetical protein